MVPLCYGCKSPAHIDGNMNQIKLGLDPISINFKLKLITDSGPRRRLGWVSLPSSCSAGFVRGSSAVEPWFPTKKRRHGSEFLEPSHALRPFAVSYLS